MIPVGTVNMMQTFRVRIGDACNHFDEIAILIDTPCGAFLPRITPTPGGFIVRYVPRYAGTHLITALLNSVHIFGSPFLVEVLPVPLLPPDLSSEERAEVEPQQQAYLVRAYGPGIRDYGFVNRICEFIIDLKPVLAEQPEPEVAGRVNVVVEGPADVAIHCKDNLDGTCSVAYLPTLIGIYYISIYYNQFPINQSPFRVAIEVEPQFSIPATRRASVLATCSRRR